MILTFRCASARSNITNIDDHRTGISSSSCRGLVLSRVWMSLNSCLRCADEHSCYMLSWHIKLCLGSNVTYLNRYCSNKSYFVSSISCGSWHMFFRVYRIIILGFRMSLDECLCRKIDNMGKAPKCERYPAWTWIRLILKWIWKISHRIRRLFPLNLFPVFSLIHSENSSIIPLLFVALSQVIRPIYISIY